MADELFLGIDVGTSALKAVVIDATGHVRGEASSAYDTLSPQPGWSEQRPEDWWRACRAAFGALGAKVVLAEIAAIGLTGQMHGAVFLDGEREVIRPAILWNDQRTAAEAAEIERVVGVERLLRITGNRSFTGFTAPKLLWLRRNQAIAYKRVQHLLLPKDYIRLMLMGDLATDVGDASGTGLLDVGARQWSPEICDELEINTGILPRVFEGPEITGSVRDDIASELGLALGTPVVAGGGDQQAGAVGAGAVIQGIAMCGIGTSGVLFAPAEAFMPESEGRLHSMCHSAPGLWHTMGVMLNAGGALSWLARAMAPIVGDDVLGRLVALAAASAPGARGLLFLPYLQGERMPVNDPRATAMFVGLTSDHDIGDMARAVMEGVAFNLRQLLGITRATGASVDELRLIGGGAQGDLWPQIIADVFEMPVGLLPSHDGAAIGAAMLAAVGAGVFASVQEAASACVRVSSVIEPQTSTAEVYRASYARYAELYPAGN